MRQIPFLIARFITALLFLSLSANLKAQMNAPSVFEAAVDQVNCETIRFIHREAGRGEIANNMECLSYESILKSVPEDESNTTGKLAKDINNSKARYKADKELGPQIDAVIAVALKRIEAKPRKQNIPDFKTRLQGIKDEALKNASALGANTPAADPANTITPPSAENTTSTEDGNITILPEGNEVAGDEGTNWLGWLSLLISLLALALSGYRFLRPATTRSAPYLPTEARTENASDGNREKSDAGIRQLEARMFQELRRVESEFEEKLSALTASTGYTEPESLPEQEDEMDESGVPSISDAMVETMDLPIEKGTVTEIPEEKKPELTSYENPKHESWITDTQAPADEEAEGDEETGETAPNAPMQATETEPEAMEEEHDQFEITSEEIAEAKEPATASSTEESTIFTPANTAPEDPITNTEPEGRTPPAAFEEDAEEEEGLPYYRYVSMPDADGTFADSRLSEASGPDSVYEVEMYEDVPNKAFFSPLPYPEVVTRVMADPDRYLAPCCTYTDDPAGKQHIIVIEEGTLRKQGDRWQVNDKARIRFA